MHQKVNWINSLKVLGILAVILGHTASPFGSIIFSWHMPLFFMIAGFFINFDLKFRDFIKKDFKRLMIPYFIFAIIGLVFETLKRIALQRDNLDYLHEIQGIFIWMDMSSLINTYAFVLWFLPALFFARLFFVVVNQYIQNIFIQLIIIMILFTGSFYVNLPFALDNGMNALFFVFAGNIFLRFFQESKFLYLLPFVALLLYLNLGIPTLDMATKNYENIAINIVFSISLVITMILIFKKASFSSNVATTWGGNTMLLFIVHPYTNNIAHVFVERFNFGDWFLKFCISIILLQVILFIKIKFESSVVFKYV